MNLRLAFVVTAAGALLAACGSSSSPSATPTPTPTPAPTAAATGGQSATGTAKVTIDPTHGKVGTVIHVVGSGYAPNEVIMGALCAVNASAAVENEFTDCDILGAVTVTTDAGGGFATAYTVKKIPPPKAAYALGFGKVGDSTQSAGAVFAIDP